MSSPTRTRLSQTCRWVVKIGSAMVTRGGQGVDLDAIDRWAAQVMALRSAGKEVVVVTSGAVAEGMLRLGWQVRPTALHELQAAAAVGQMGLAQAYESVFQRHGMRTAQILLTHDDLRDRVRYLNARSTLRTLLGHAVIPVVNENDTVATEEIRFGDNDTLAALVANLVEADVLVILTDQQGLYTADPRKDPHARLLHEVQASDSRLAGMASSEGGVLGRGGMATKVRAAQRAARSGAATLIAAGSEPEVLTRLAGGEELGTVFLPDQVPLLARKQWLASQLHVAGRLAIDEGAARVLREDGRSLLPVGVIAVEGGFQRGDLVAVVGPDGQDIARGLVNYGADEARRIQGQPSHVLPALLGYEDEPELIHRDNLVLI
ncbi:MAG: glutamate 5-kinase [Pseudomonadota bacterium]